MVETMSSQEFTSNPDIEAEFVDDDVEKNASETNQQQPEEKRTEVSKRGDYDDEPDETLCERLWGLTEMFPESVRKITSSAIVATKLGLCKARAASRTATWIIFSSSVLLFAPLVLEVERVNIQELQKNQRKELLIGPSGAISGGVPPMLVPSIS
ncbi:unnamed protein product [Ceutorhynchus assimilis]|uniref:Mitochondrial import receptor subunit TOM22 homolog n=1 Tax=Ceutorhynchus assimilis TaxID=467358 RepID=A0A9P0GQU1_9CUCU|nr:unnamed protein product [Ceutorhynchus assimilis]